MFTSRIRSGTSFVMFAATSIALITACGASSPRAQQGLVPTPTSVSTSDQSLNAASLETGSSRLETAVPSSIVSSPTIPPTSSFDDQDNAELAYLEGELQRTDLDPTARAGIEDQISSLRYWIGQRATAVALGITPPSQVTPFAPDATSTPFPRGIIPSQSGITTPPRIDETFIAENGWTDGNTLAFYAGVARYDERKGAIVALERISDGIIKEDWYFTPVEIGSIRIIGEQNDVLLLQAADGAFFSFNVLTRAFSQDVPVLTPTASP